MNVTTLRKSILPQSGFMKTFAKSAQKENFKRVTIFGVGIDVSEESFADLETEAVRMMKRD